MEHDWPQVLIEWADWSGAERDAAELLRPRLEEAEQRGTVGPWHFIRKSPHWRLRYAGTPDARAHLEEMLTGLRRQGAVTRWAHGIYEGESAAFGGPAAMDVAHTLFCADSRGVLAYLARRGQAVGTELGRRETAMLLASVLLRAAGLDWYEQGDVWARVTGLRRGEGSTPAGTDLVGKVRRLMTVDAELLVDAGALAEAGDWVQAYKTAGADLARLASQGALQRGLRAVCVHHIIFCWNRLGLPARDQHRLANAAKEAVMSDRTTPTTTTDKEGSATTLRRALVDRLREGGHITSRQVEEAFRAVPRHLFVPAAPLDDAYANQAVHIKHDTAGTSLSCASQPQIVARMLEQLQARPGQRVLELGAGTGFNAALLGHLVGSQGRVTTIDVDGDLVEGARRHLKDADADNVEVLLGDGALGHPDGSPYQRITATVGSHIIPTAWFDQLAPGGRLVAPVRIAGDVSYSIAFEADGDHYTSVSSELCTFMPLRGGIGEDPRRVLDLTGDGTVCVQANQDQRIEEGQVQGVLSEPRREVWTDVTFTKAQPLDAMWLWLAVALENSLSRMPVRVEAIEGGLVTPMLPWGSMASVPASARGLAYLALRPVPGTDHTYQAGVIGHATAGHTLAQQMAAQITTWEAHRTDGLAFSWYPDGSRTPEPGPARFVLDRGSVRLAVEWIGTR